MNFIWTIIIIFCFIFSIITNNFTTLINSLFDAIPVAWDMYSNFVYRLVEGVKFGDKI